MYDYAKYKFFKEQYEEAGIYFRKCKELHTNLIPSSFYKINLEELNGFCVACSSEITNTSSLLMQFLYSTQTNYNVNISYIILLDVILLLLFVTGNS